MEFYESVQSSLERIASHEEAMNKLAEKHLEQHFSDNSTMEEVWKQQSNKTFVEFMLKAYVVVGKRLEEIEGAMICKNNNNLDRSNFRPSKERETLFDKNWKSHFDELVKFKQVHSHCNASRTMKGYEQLGNWLADQRRKYRKGKLTEEQYRMLTDLGMVFRR